MQKMRHLRQSDKRVTEYGCRFGNKGFTLVEVLIAVVIMAIVAIPLLHAFSTTANTSAKAKFKMIATNAADATKMDMLFEVNGTEKKSHTGPNPFYYDEGSTTFYFGIYSTTTDGSWYVVKTCDIK